MFINVIDIGVRSYGIYKIIINMVNKSVEKMGKVKGRGI